MARAPTWAQVRFGAQGDGLSPAVPPLDLSSGASEGPSHRPAGLLTTKVAGARLCGTGTMKHCQCRRAWIPGLPWPPPPAQAGQVPPRSNMLVSIFPQGLLQGSPDRVRGTPDAATTLSLPPPPHPGAPHPGVSEQGPSFISAEGGSEGRGTMDGALPWGSKHTTGAPYFPRWGGGLQPRYTDTTSRTVQGRSEGPEPSGDSKWDFRIIWWGHC